jgi:hypothetical protein
LIDARQDVLQLAAASIGGPIMAFMKGEIKAVEELCVATLSAHVLSSRFAFANEQSSIPQYFRQYVSKLVV